jgi:protein-S-isoprenylcysteine O-methyltransferase Ste14
MDAKERRRLFFETCVNVSGGLIYILCTAAMLVDYWHTDRPSDLFMIMLTTIFSFLFLTRTTPPVKSNTSPRDWLIALCGSYFQGFFRPVPDAHDILAGQLLQGFGMCLALLGVLTLNSSFGMVAANRGIKTYGIYKYLRHPIYAGYCLVGLGFLSQNLTLANGLIFALWLMFEARRIVVEEEYLSEDPAYAAYLKRTRWRIIPYVF